jgi:hypothetical protein
MSEKEVKKCPQCGRELEKGYIHVPRGVYWDAQRHKHSIWASTKMEAIISMWSWTLPYASVWRCKQCKIVVFNY